MHCSCFVSIPKDEKKLLTRSHDQLSSRRKKMKRAIWYIFTLSIIHSPFCLGGRINRDLTDLITKQEAEPDLIWRSSKNWADFPKLTSSKDKLTESQYQDIIAFWRRGNEEITMELNALLQEYPYVTCRTNDLVFFHKKESWDKELPWLLGGIQTMVQSHSVMAKEAGLKVIHQFLKLDNIPGDALQVLHHWLLQRCDLSLPAELVHTGQLREDLLRALEILNAKYIEYIRNLGDGKPLKDFVKMQRELFNGIVLTGDWTSQNQKELYEFWISDINGFYYKIQNHRRLQNALETQVLQTKLIEVKHIGKYTHQLGHSVLNWTRSELIKGSKTVVNYIKSLEFDREISDFIEIQKYIRPYGLNIDKDREMAQILKVIQFWATHVQIFLLINKLEDTKSLQTVIEDFVVKDFDEVSMIMGNFLKTLHTCTAEDTALAQFLKFYSITTQSTVNKEITKKALDQFNKKAVAVKAQGQLFNKEVSENALSH
ncbi:hypothetical protein DFH28DRAFT_579802 [Melampsora americana]|nr:hypothetical protein DFH28DRAFT_579802 [Melampsora americana]